MDGICAGLLCSFDDLAADEIAFIGWGSADMDSDLNRAEQSVVTKMSERNPKFSAFVPLFLSEVHQLLDFTISRIEKMRQDGLVGQTGTPSTE